VSPAVGTVQPGQVSAWLTDLCNSCTPVSIIIVIISDSQTVPVSAAIVANVSTLGMYRIVVSDSSAEYEYEQLKDTKHSDIINISSVQFSSVTIFMSRASLIIQDYDGCAHA